MRNNDQSKIDNNSWDEIHVDDWFRGLIPADWEIEDDEEVIIFDPAGFGEIRMNMFLKNDNKSRKQRALEIIREWSNELGPSYEKEVSIFKRRREVFAFSAEFIGSEPDGDMVYWRIFPFIGDKITLDISYSCSLEDRDRERAVVENIIDSISLMEKIEYKLKVPLVD